MTALLMVLCLCLGWGAAEATRKHRELVKWAWRYVMARARWGLHD